MCVFSFTRSTTEMKSYRWLSVTAMGFLLSQIGVKAASECSSGEFAISGMFLKGHTFRTVQVEGPFQCLQICKQEQRCQSYNFVITNKVCELSKRIKEARPEDFLPDVNHSRPQRLRSSWPAPRIETSGRLQFSVRDSRTSDLSAQSRTFIKMVDQAINFGQEIQNFSDIT